MHEWGHYYAARKGGVDVEEFGLGFPPRAWGKKLKSGMILSINWLPLGGFVKLKGEQDADQRKGSFGAATTSTKIKIMLAGVTVNFVFGVLLLTVLALVGMPKAIDNQFSVASDTKVVHQEVRAGFVDDNTPASKAGLQPKDKIMAVSCAEKSCAGQSIEVNSRQSLRSATKNFEGKAVNLSIERNNQNLTFKNVHLRSTQQVEDSLKTDHPQGYLGIVPTELIVQRSTWSAPIVALGFTKQLTVLTLKGIGSALQGLGSTIAGLATSNTTARQNGQAQATEQTGGIVAIMAIIWESGSLGAIFMLLIIAILSLTLAIMNVLPIPALDGGRLFITLLFKGMRRPLTQITEQRIHGTGMAVLLSLFLLITIVDVRRFF